jgi:hypothetical protein
LADFELSIENLSHRWMLECKLRISTKLLKIVTHAAIFTWQTVLAALSLPLWLVLAGFFGA